MRVNINVEEQLWKELVEKYNMSGVITYFLKKFKIDGKFPEIKEVFAKV